MTTKDREDDKTAEDRIRLARALLKCKEKILLSRDEKAALEGVREHRALRLLRLLETDKQRVM